MTRPSTGTVELHFASGEPIAAWESYSLRQSFTDPLGDFSFTVTPPQAKRTTYRERLAKGAEVSIAIDGAKQATAIIAGNEHSVDATGYALNIICKSTLVTAYQASVDPRIASSFQSDTPIADAVLSALAPFGFESVITDVTAEVEALTGKSLSGRAAAVTLDDLKHKDVRANHGDAAYQFAARLFTRLGLALVTDREGTLLLRAPDYEQSEAYTLIQGEGGGDRFLAQPGLRVSDTNDGQFSETIVIGKAADRKGQTAAATPAAGVRVPGVDRPDGVPFEDVDMTILAEGRHNYAGPWKPRYYLDKRARDVERCRNVAHLIHGATARRAYQLRGSVDGLVSTSGQAIWSVDTVARVKIDALELDENMWILETNKTGSRKGQMTQLTLIPLYSLVLGA